MTYDTLLILTNSMAEYGSTILQYYLVYSTCYHTFLLIPVAILKLDFVTIFLYASSFYFNMKLFAFDASLLRDFSTGFGFVFTTPFTIWVAPNNLDDAFNYYFRFLWVFPNLPIIVSAGCSLFIVRWESSFSFLNILLR